MKVKLIHCININEIAYGLWFKYLRQLIALLINRKVFSPKLENLFLTACWIHSNWCSVMLQRTNWTCQNIKYKSCNRYQLVNGLHLCKILCPKCIQLYQVLLCATSLQEMGDLGSPKLTIFSLFKWSLFTVSFYPCSTFKHFKQLMRCHPRPLLCSVNVKYSRHFSIIMCERKFNSLFLNIIFVVFFVFLKTSPFTCGLLWVHSLGRTLCIRTLLIN